MTDTDHEPIDDRGFEALLASIKANRGLDFNGYKRPSLMRRVRCRMSAVALATFAEYADHLQAHPEEFILLLDTLLINVTAFFRDPLAWEHLASEVVPRLIESKPPGEPIRVWSAGCASGEEAFTLAMVLAEALGVDAFRDRVKIYATDMDEGALARARTAAYNPREVESVPPALRDKYFGPFNQRLAFHRDLRRSMIFGRHDLIQDAPISRVDLLVCRNTLMYFTSETQSRILDRLHFALTDRGVLFLGKAETLLTYSSMFTPVELKHRIFAKVSRANARERIVLALGRDGGAADPNARLREAVFETVPVAQLVVNRDGVMILANERARSLFRLAVTDIGRPLRDLEVSYKPVELRSCIERATADRQPVTVHNVEWVRGSGNGVPGPVLTLDIQVVPLFAGPGGDLLGTSVTFNDVSNFKALETELQNANHELETAYEELQSTNEELETTNEELQSSIEELETTNEELQSTNEELETMNEELQSTNEELQTLNDELRQRGGELNEVNDFLEAVFRSLRGAVVVVDRDLVTQVWNHRAEDLWGLRSAEVVGKPLLNLDIGLPVEQLKPSLKACLAGETGEAEVVLDAANRRGRAIRCRVTCAPLCGPDNEVKGVIVLMAEQEPSPH